MHSESWNVRAQGIPEVVRVSCLTAQLRKVSPGQGRNVPKVAALDTGRARAGPRLGCGQLCCWLTLTLTLLGLSPWTGCTPVCEQLLKISATEPRGEPV